MARRRFSEAELDALFGVGSPQAAPKSPEKAPAPAPSSADEPKAPRREPRESLPELEGPTPPSPAPQATSPTPIVTETTTSPGDKPNAVVAISIAAIEPNPHQPRVEFDDARLHEMAGSIRERGVLQPILVRRSGSKYQLVAGERRLRASKLAGLDSIPALVVALNDRDLLEVALVENLQRDDLNPVEEARAYDYLCRQFGLSHEEVARRVGKDRSTVVNMLRLLRLPQAVKNDLQNRTLSTGHGRALLALDGEEQMLHVHREIVAKGLSVRQTEDRVRELTGGNQPARRKPRRESALAPEIEDLQARMTEAIGVRVRLHPRTDTAGRVEILYSTLDELDAICGKLGVTSEEM